MGPEESPFFRFPINPTARVLRGFQKAGGPPFLDMRPSDVWSPTVAPRSVAAPNCLEYPICRWCAASIRSQTRREVLSFDPFVKKRAWVNSLAVRAPRAHHDSTLLQNRRSRKLRVVSAPASPTRCWCSDPNRNLFALSGRSGSLVSYGHRLPKGTNDFQPRSTTRTRTRFINKGYCAKLS
jgi:hypothetical protein